MSLDRVHEWTGESSDPDDEQFGDVVENATLAAADGYDAVLVGEPYDGAVLGRPGAREGPAAIRRELANLKTAHFDAGPVRSVADLGDVDVGPADGDVAAVQSRVREVAERVHDSGAFPVFLGGDNSLTYPNAAPLLDDGLGAVNLDAHLDCRTLHEGPTSGTPYRQLLAADPGLAGLSVVGARHFETTAAYREYVRERGGEIVTAEEVGADPVGAVRTALANLDDVDRLYCSVDLDVLDAAHAPGVSAPTPGGLTPRELFRIVRVVAGDERLAGFEVVECSPPLDRGGRTTATAARTVAHALAARARTGGRA